MGFEKYAFYAGELNYNIPKIIIERYQDDIIKRLYSEDKDIVKQSCYLLGKAKIDKSVDDICNVLENFDDIYVKRRAILALGSIGDSKALPHIKKYQNHRTKTLKKTVVEVLSIFEEENQQFIKETNNNVEIPIWNEYYPDLENCSEEQKDFYYAWLSEKNKGNYLDINGNLSYVFYYLYTIIFKFKEDKNFDNLVKEFDDIIFNYNQYPEFKHYIDSWKIEALFYLNREDIVWNELIRQDNLSLDLILNSVSFLDKYNLDDINGIDIVKIMDSSSMIGYQTLSDFGKKNKKEIGDIVSKKLKEFENLYNEDIFNYFLSLTNDDYEHVKNFYSYKEFEDYTSLDDYYKGNKKISGFYFSYPFTSVIESINESINMPFFIYFALICELKRIIRESENECRKLHGIPSIGEGWVSETELFYQIKNSFENEIVIAHGSPKWLGRQHLDIYFPEHNIGIEYQGEQHEKAIDLFGGEEGLKYRKELDKKKLKLCEENNCDLIYVYPDYNFKLDVLDKINEILKKE